MWVLGNGESRSNIDIDLLTGEKVGCNAIYRDYFVDHLVCVDRRMVEEAINEGVNVKGTLVYTRSEWYPQYKTLKVRQVPPLPYQGNQRWDEPFQWGSGPYAALLGSIHTKIECVNLLGFDLHSKTKTINNVYKDTDNYDRSDKRAVDPRYWIHQIGMVIKYFPGIQFKIYQEADWVLPPAWNQPNVSVDTLSNISYNR